MGLGIAVLLGLGNLSAGLTFNAKQEPRDGSSKEEENER